MSFITPAYLIFLLIVWPLYWSLRRRGQNVLILLASFFFYGWWDWRFLALLITTTGIDYAAALAMNAARTQAGRRGWLLVSLVSNLGVLCFFKYFNFFSQSFTQLLHTLGFSANPVLLRVILPLGISFYTFQALSYTIDVYRRRLPPVRDVVGYFCFISFFPHLVAGPINFAKDLLQQFEQDRHFDKAEAADGARQMLLGYLKKMVIADNLAPLVNHAYGNVAHATGWQLLWATYGFAFQIYCDFSGYTDIAIGTAKLFNLRLMRNFAAPYFSQSIPEFWRRWHISLSTWFREYVYISLGGNRTSKPRQAFNIAAVFLLSGLWHGANWTFIVWGGLHGLFYLGYWLLLPDSLKDQEETSPGRRFVRTIITFHLVCFAWIFFRANSLADAGLIVARIAQTVVSSIPSGFPVTILLSAVVLCLFEWLSRRSAHAFDLARWRTPVRWAFYYAMTLIIIGFANVHYVPFIYFDF
jgi:D-alanyl-lipoteichoic acid acyltransferase DltB (MBOAT superfamily)